MGGRGLAQCKVKNQPRCQRTPPCVARKEGPSEITLRNLELDVIAKMFLGCLGMDMRRCCQQRGVQPAILGVATELECPFTEARAHALSLAILDAEQPSSADVASGRRNDTLGGSLHRKFDNMKLFAALLGVPQVILSLLIEPALSRCAERYGQANGHLGTDTRATVENSG